MSDNTTLHENIVSRFHFISYRVKYPSVGVSPHQRSGHSLWHYSRHSEGALLFKPCILHSHQDHKRKLIPVCCTVEINQETLSRFLEEAYTSVIEGHQRLAFVTTKPATPDQKPSKPPAEAFPSPFTDKTGPRGVIEAVSSQPNFTDEVLVLLDKETSETRLSCRLVSRYIKQFDSVRSDFSSAQVALEAILNGASNTQRLRNEAAMAGGVLRDYPSSRGTIKHGQVEDIIRFKNKAPSDLTWERCCKLICGRQDTITIPVFCTADMPLEVLNTFIEETIHPPDFPEDNPSGIRLIDSLDLDKLQASQTRTPYAETFASAFLEKKPQAIDYIVRSQFPGTSLNCVHFIILDSVTIRDRTCILADNQLKKDPFLMLVRSDFRSALGAIVCATCTGLNFDVMSEDAPEHDGIAMPLTRR